jgi:hypothetical protein
VHRPTAVDRTGAGGAAQFPGALAQRSDADARCQVGDLHVRPAYDGVRQAVTDVALLRVTVRWRDVVEMPFSRSLGLCVRLLRTECHDSVVRTVTLRFRYLLLFT